MSTADGSGSFAPWRPQACLAHLVMSHVGEEVLVYDETRHAIHRLNPTSNAVWALCDGTRTLTDLAQAASAALASVSAPSAALASSHCVPLADPCSPGGKPCCPDLVHGPAVCFDVTEDHSGSYFCFLAS